VDPDVTGRRRSPGRRKVPVSRRPSTTSGTCTLVDDSPQAWAVRGKVVEVHELEDGTVKIGHRAIELTPGSFARTATPDPFLVLTFVGWIRTLLAPGESPAAPEDVETAGARATG
jgi:hypothetical protein